jgi:two-component sensor histidine kinase
LLYFHILGVMLRETAATMQRFMDILAWRSRQSSLVKWGAALALFLLAFSARAGLGTLHGANPFLAFYPAVMLSVILLGWKQALAVLLLAVATGAYLFLSPGLFLLPVGWIVVGGLNIAIITALQSAAEELVAANERQRILFQEVQHRVANTLQAVVGTLEIARKRIMSSPAEAARLMEEAAQRFAASADVHRRLNDPALFRRALGSILRDAVSTVIDRNTVRVSIDVEEFNLTFDQMSSVTMMVIEIANNSQKHVFQHGYGKSFSVSLRATPGDQAMLTIRDDGPGLMQSSGGGSIEHKLGLRIVRGLVSHLHGTLSLIPGYGTEIIVEFPLLRPTHQPRREVSMMPANGSAAITNS